MPATAWWRGRCCTEAISRASGGRSPGDFRPGSRTPHRPATVAYGAAGGSAARRESHIAAVARHRRRLHRHRARAGAAARRGRRRRARRRCAADDRQSGRHRLGDARYVLSETLRGPRGSAHWHLPAICRRARDRDAARARNRGAALRPHCHLARRARLVGAGDVDRGDRAAAIADPARRNFTRCCLDLPGRRSPRSRPSSCSAKV